MNQQIDLQKVYEKLRRIEEAMITRNDMADILETMEILSNQDTMNQIASSQADIDSGRVMEINSINDI